MSNERPLVPILVSVCALVTLAAALLLGLALTHNLNATSTPLAVSIFGTIGTIISILLLAFQASQNAKGVDEVHRLVDGHIGEHTELVNTLASKLPPAEAPAQPGPQPEP